MELSPKTISSLQNIVGKPFFRNSMEDRVCYGYDATAMEFLPDAVVFPENVDQVAEVLKIANRERIPVIPRGAGSGMTGGALAVAGGIVIATTRLDRVIRIDRENLTAEVQTGVITGHLHRAVAEAGLFYPPDPSSSDFSTIGGNLGACAGGPRAVKYGVTRDYVLGLEVVLASGQVIRTGVKTMKGVVGYDLTRLLVGSEGTLGVIVRAVLKLIPQPECIRTMTAAFDSMEGAGAAVSEIIAGGVVPRCLEFMDQASMQCVENTYHYGLPVDAGAMLLMEADGPMSAVAAEIEKMAAVCRRRGAKTTVAQNDAEAALLWKARKSISPALFTYGSRKINEDIVVPRNRVPDIVSRINRLREKSGLNIVSFGHAGDGNIHVNIMLDRDDEAASKKAGWVLEALFNETLALGGTISGEHGVGITKKPFVGKEIGAVALQVMKDIKQVFDPRGIMNPGKIFPEDDAVLSQ